MFRLLRRRHGPWLAIGLVIGGLAGVLVSGLLPSNSAHGVATDRYENFAIATGPLDNEVEAVYFLDFLTGDLKAAVLNINTGTFTAFYSYNILQDLGIDPAKNPRYLMVTGVADLRRVGGSNVRPGASVVYIAELTTGKIAAYAVPWSPDLHKRGAPFQGALMPLDVTQFRTTAVRDQ
jgi:hypothetical protein